MAVALDRQIRKVLEKAVREARSLAEEGARKALTAIGVEDARRPTGLAEADIDLRNRLRAHARSLGDVMASDDSIKASRLTREIAYEHWHRALFARFLAENNLLVDPEHRVSVSLSDLEEIAREEGRDPVELAAEWAEPMLPQIFRKDDPALALALPPETRAGLIDMVKGLPRAVFTADDSLGWVYQFWQADQKDRINASEVKIGADELPAVTQLFTEDYMVLFLLENTLGAWWAGKALAGDPALAAGASTEDELREKTSPAGYRWTYLRFVREPRDGETHDTATGPWRPAAGSYDGWPKAAKDITVLDPCMGSGHFLVFALPILVALRRAEAGLDERAAMKAVLADNLFGLEIDPRCTQIAAFALALASWKWLGGPEPLPRLNLACSGLAIGLGKAEFLKLAERVAAKRGWKPNTDLLGDGASPIESAVIQREREGLSRLYELFGQAPTLGSLIDPRVAGSDLFAEGYEKLAELLSDILEAGQAPPDAREVAVTAQGLAKAAGLLSHKFTLAVTNVPYLLRRKQSIEIKQFCEGCYPESKNDIATVFIERAERLMTPAGTIAAVTPQAWLYLITYSDLRKRLLQEKTIDFVATLGSGAFETIGGEVVNITLVSISNVRRHADPFYYCDATEVQAKASYLIEACPQFAFQTKQLSAQGHRIVSNPETDVPVLGKYARSVNGLTTGDLPRMTARFWDLSKVSGSWRYLQTTGEGTKTFGGLDGILRWDNGNSIRELPGGFLRGGDVWGHRGILIKQTGELQASLYSGEAFEVSTSVLVPSDDSILPEMWAFCSSSDYNKSVRSIDKSLKVTNATLVQVPFDFPAWRHTAQECWPNGLPKPYCNDPTQWLFDGHPRGGADPNDGQKMAPNPLIARDGVRPGLAEHPLQVAVARLLGYRWPRQTGSSFMDCPAVTEPDEVDRSGLIDSDGIVPLPAIAGKADGPTRLRDLIRAVWGPDYRDDTLRGLLAAEEAKAADLGAWLADEFFDGHCRLFHQTPFIWHIWDGARGGFSAIVNYHRLCEGNGAGRRLLEKLRDSYLGEWIGAQRRALAAGEAGAEARLIAAEHLRGELTGIIEGDPPYDIFVRWKPVDCQPIGWEPDIDDGVRLNIRPFLIAKPKDSGRRDGCILRVTPRVKKHAGADRGGEPHRAKEDFPWFWAGDDDVAITDFAGGSEFKGRRYNDFHYSRAFKQRARAAKGNPGEGEAA